MNDVTRHLHKVEMAVGGILHGVEKKQAGMESRLADAQRARMHQPFPYGGYGTAIAKLGAGEMPGGDGGVHVFLCPLGGVVKYPL